MFLCVFTAAAAAVQLVLIFAARCFLLFGFPAGDMMKDCVSEFNLARQPRLGPATSGTQLITTALLRRKTFPQLHESVGIRQSWNFWPELKSGREFWSLWAVKCSIYRIMFEKTFMKSNTGLRIKEENILPKIHTRSQYCMFPLTLLTLCTRKTHPRFQVKIPDISFCSAVLSAIFCCTCSNLFAMTFCYIR